VFNSLNSARGRGDLHVRSFVPTSLGMAGIPLILMWFFIGEFSFDGVAWAWTLGQAVVAIGSIRGLSRAARIA